MEKPLNIYADNGKFLDEEGTLAARLFVYLDDERLSGSPEHEISLKIIAYLDQDKDGQHHYQDHVMLKSIRRCIDTDEEVDIEFCIEDQSEEVQQAIKYSVEEWADRFTA